MPADFDPAPDLLREAGLDDAAARLEAEPALRALLGRAVALLEDAVRAECEALWYNPDPADYPLDPALAVIAAATGETPRAALDRIHPPLPVLDRGTTDAALLRYIYGPNGSAAGSPYVVPREAGPGDAPDGR